MTINNNYNFGLLTDDGTTSTPTSLQNLKSFTVNYDSTSGLYSVDNNLSDYSIQYFNRLQTSNGLGGESYGGLCVTNKKGNNFVILCECAQQSLITQANIIIMNGPGTIPNLDNINGLFSITYPEIPTFINGYCGYNIPKDVLPPVTLTFYLMD